MRQFAIIFDLSYQITLNLLSFLNAYIFKELSTHEEERKITQSLDNTYFAVIL